MNFIPYAPFMNHHTINYLKILLVMPIIIMLRIILKSFDPLTIHNLLIVFPMVILVILLRIQTFLFYFLITSSILNFKKNQLIILKNRFTLIIVNKFL